MYKLYEDPGHAWLKVEIGELRQLGIFSKISGYSYVNGNFAYLEEDCDLSVFCEAYKAQNGKMPEWETVYQERTPIRNYERFGMEYELARRIGDNRYGSECRHLIVINGKCSTCQRKVI